MKFNKWIFIIIRMIVVFFLLIVSVFILAKNCVFSAEQAENADGMIFLMGGDSDRIQFAANIYKLGLAPKIWMVNLDEKGGNHVNKYGIPLREIVIREKFELIKAGIDSSAIEIIDGPSNSTFDEAIRMSEFLLENTTVKKLLIITSATHTGRADYIFEDLFKTFRLDVNVITPANNFSNINQANCRFNFETLKICFTECFKWSYYFLFRKTWFN